MPMSLSLSQWFSIGDNSVPLLPGDILQSLKTFIVVISQREYAPGIQWPEAGDVAKHTAIYSTAPQTKNYPAQSVSSSEAKKPGPRLLLAA